MTSSKFKLTALLALALAGMAIASASAFAHGHGSRAARLDSDKDAASNLCEQQAGLDSTNTDTDGNGTIDGLEDSDGDGANNAAESRLRSNCGVANKRFRIKHATVVSYSDADGLTLKIGKKGLVTAPVSSKVVCEQDDNSSDASADDGNTASVSRHGGDDPAGDDNGGDRSGPGGSDDGPGDDNGGKRGGRDDGPGDRGGDNGGEEDTVACTTSDLVADASVLGAKIKNGAYTRIHLAAADEDTF